MKKRKESDKHKNRGRRRIILGTALLALSCLTLWACAKFRFDKWHRLEPELIRDCKKSLLVYDKNGGLACAAGSVKRIPISIEELSATTVNAFIAAEDNRFYSHDGIDLYRIFGAAWADIKAGGFVQGASTISQQLIKLSHLSSDKTFDRKLEEAVLALELEHSFSKDEIMEMYLNYVYFGGGYYGIEAASLGYFNRHARELTAAQAAQLAGILKSPSAYAPHIDEEASLARRNAVLGLMYENGFLTKKELDSALDERSEILSAFPNERSCFTDYAIRKACEILGMDESELSASGYSVYTTLDSEINEACETLMNNDASFPSDNAQGAVVMLSSDGGIIAMQGCRGEYAAGSLNRAADIERQPGSLIKPVLVYAPALEIGGYTAASLLNDEPMSFSDYTPRNSDEKYYGSVTLRQAVTKSLNVPAVSVLNDVGLDNCILFAERMGISFKGEDRTLALALGGFTRGVSPLEMAGAYAAFANGGVYIEPYCITRIVDSRGVTVYEHGLSGERVMKRGNAYILTSMLQSAASEGTAKRLAASGLPLAAKTGTSVDASGVRDAWCACYSPEYAAVVWMGTDSSQEGSLPADAVGGSCPAIMLGSIFSAIYSGRDFPEFNKPEDVETLEIDVYGYGDGKNYLSAALTPQEYSMREYFLQGSGPEEESGRWIMPEPPDELGWSINSDGKPIISFVAKDPLLIYTLYKKTASGGSDAVAEFEGKQGYVSWTDTSAEAGTRSIYYITATHPDIKENGVPLIGMPSKELEIDLPKQAG